jgi:hypothetical protein
LALAEALASVERNVADSFHRLAHGRDAANHRVCL